MAKSKSGPHGVRHPLTWLSAETGIPKTNLIRLFGNEEERTFREVLEAQTAKQDREKDRQRRQKAEADSAELEAAEKRGTLMLKEKAVRWFSDFGTFVRAQIMGGKMVEEEKKRICNTIAEWKPER